MAKCVGLIKRVMKAEKEAKPNIIVDLSNACTAYSPGKVLWFVYRYYLLKWYWFNNALCVDSVAFNHNWDVYNQWTRLGY